MVIDYDWFVSILMKKNDKNFFSIESMEMKLCSFFVFYRNKNSFSVISKHYFVQYLARNFIKNLSLIFVCTRMSGSVYIICSVHFLPFCLCAAIFFEAIYLLIYSISWINLFSLYLFFMSFAQKFSNTGRNKESGADNEQMDVIELIFGSTTTVFMAMQFA